MIQSLFSRIFGHDTTDTRPGEIDPHRGKAQTVAKKRLQFLLVHDRVQLSPAQMEMMRNELLEVLSRYVEIDQDDLAIDLRPVPESRKMALVSNIPVKRVLIHDDSH